MQEVTIGVHGISESGKEAVLEWIAEEADRRGYKVEKIGKYKIALEWSSAFEIIYRRPD